MESTPPSYEKATSTDPWNLIAQYINSNDLCSAALVCSSWHQIFAPHLWGNPASHFGTENDRVYVALTKFKRTLPGARLSVRSLTHTLHLPPAHAELYYGPHVDWLREVLSRLPNLQSLIVRGLPFFDHAALNALKFLNSNSYASFELRLLDASRLLNVTAVGLCQALRRFTSMLYLDLSFTYPARDHTVLKMLWYMPGLQVLKLRGISLRDNDVKVLAAAISTKVRSLDLRDNLLTDRSVRTLLDSCFTPNPASNPSGREGSSSLLQYLGADLLAIYRGEHFESYIRKAFTTGFVNRLAIEETAESGTGITHLYMSNNQLTVEGVSGLLRSGRLHVFDIGAVKPDIDNHPNFSQDEGLDRMALPGAEKLTPVLVEGGRSLTFLRIDHRLITQEPMKANELETIPGRVELADTSPMPIISTPYEPVELPSNEVYELSAEVPQVFELSGDLVQIKVSPAVEKSIASGVEQEYDMTKRRGSEVAPEVAISPQETSGSFLHPSLSDQNSQPEESTNMSFGRPTRTGRPRTYSSVVAERACRVKTQLSLAKGCHPGVLPSLVTLTLTDFPPYSLSTSTADRFTAFIHDCADEARLAHAQARLDYSAPPGRKGYANTARDAARTIFPLQEIVLEVARDQPARRKGPASAWRHHGTKSVTQDRDSEVLACAAETDFSFFGEYDDDLPSLEVGREAPFPAMGGLEVALPDQEQHASISERDKYEEDSEPRIDVITRISEFRKAKRAAYRAHVTSGETYPNIDGFWEGNVKVVRPSSTANPVDEDDEILADYYGNRFSNGYLYR